MTAYEMRISDWSSDVFSSDLNADAVAARQLGPVKCAVSAADQRIEYQVAFPQTRNAKAGRQAAMGHFFMRMAFYFTARAFHHMDGIGGAGIEQDHTEFIAAQSAQNISMPDRSLHIFRKGDKSPVPRAMSQLVV